MAMSAGAASARRLRANTAWALHCCQIGIPMIVELPTVNIRVDRASSSRRRRLVKAIAARPSSTRSLRIRRTAVAWARCGCQCCPWDRATCACISDEGAMDGCGNVACLAAVDSARPRRTQSHGDRAADGPARSGVRNIPLQRVVTLNPIQIPPYLPPTPATTRHPTISPPPSPASAAASTASAAAAHRPRQTARHDVDL